MGNSPQPPEQTPPPGGRPDASRGQVILYAVGNIEGAIANQFYNILNTVSVVVLAMNPLVIGLIMSLKTIWDAVTDPVMAQITDNAHTRRGRRIPFIFAGGVLRPLFLLAVFLFFPVSASIKSNAELQREQAAKNIAAAEAAANPQAAATPAVKTAPADAGGFLAGWDAFFSDDNAYQRHVAVYLLVAALVFALISTVQSVPYYALGIELCPSYDGRTRVVTYRAFADKAMSLVTPWILPFIFLPVFTTALDGLVWYAVIVCLVGIPATVAMCRAISEPPYDAGHKRPPAPPLLRSIWLTMRNPHFLKILFLYVFIGFTNAIFAQVGTFLVLYWVFAGDVLQGSVMNGYAATLAVILGFASLPLINWASRHIGKHRALRYAIVWLSIGTALKWWLWNPHHPYLLLILPLFHSVGIASVFTLLPSLMADVTDIDELQTGVRREGMFGAVMAFLIKAIGSLQPVLGAGILVACGFDASLGAAQPDDVFLRMRVLVSLIPAGLLLLALVALFRYPLTRQRMEEVKRLLAARQADAAA